MNKTANRPSMDSISIQIEALSNSMRSINAFVMDKFGELLKPVSDAVVGGNDDEAIDKGILALKGGRTIFAAFIRNSVAEGDKAFFNRAITQRRDVDHYDPDLVSRMEAGRKDLQTVLTTETGGIFDQRVKAHNALSMTLREVDETQRKRNRVRRVLKEAMSSLQNGAPRRTGVSTPQREAVHA